MATGTASTDAMLTTGSNDAVRASARPSVTIFGREPSLQRGTYERRLRARAARNTPRGGLSPYTDVFNYLGDRRALRYRQRLRR